MDVARELLERLDRAELPLLVTAEEQLAGRGRMGRRWEAPPGSALLLSLAFRPTWLSPVSGMALVWMAAVALCEAVEETTGLNPRLKWPNDLLLPTKNDLPLNDEDRAAEAGTTSRMAFAKAAGILLETGLGAGRVEWAILGCGVNVGAAPPPEATRYPATSLEAAAGAPVSRLRLLRALLRRLDRWYVQLQSGDHGALFGAWQARLAGIGAPVQVETVAGNLLGIAEAVNRQGALLVRDRTGQLHTVTTGDVGLVR